MADAGNSDILPPNKVAKQGQSYGYPGERGSGKSVTQAEPTTRNNGNVDKHK